MTEVADDLRSAAREYRELQERVDDHEGDVERAAAAYREFASLLDSSQEDATGSGFEAYVRFQERVDELVEALPDGIAAREAFDAADDTLQQRRLSASDFDEARHDLRPARDLAELVEARDTAAERYRNRHRETRRRIEELDDEIERLERLRALGEADLDAPVEQLQKPIAAYDDAVRDEFQTFRRDAPAREVFELVEYASAFPLVGWRVPPDGLGDYVAAEDAGEQPIPTLLEYADYSNSKLDHYVDNPATLKRHVATNRTYLQNLTADAVTIGWPPPASNHLRYITREYESVVRRFAGEETLARLRDVRGLPDRTDYGRLREAAVARAKLDDVERKRVTNGAVEDDLLAAREERAELAAALEEYPGP